MSLICITYNFVFPDNSSHNYTINIDENSLSFIPPTHQTFPEWTKLDNQKCSHCPLQIHEFPNCPIASNLSHLVEFFKDHISYEQATVTVTTIERTYSKHLRLQEGIFSIFGLIMSVSSCPHMNFLKPMARFHLPFSTAKETIVRSVSMYLLKQYFVSKRGGIPDLKLDQLEAQYENIKMVNLGIINRLRKVATSDADLNAMIVLHTFADLLTLAISKDLSSLENLFITE